MVEDVAASFRINVHRTAEYNTKHQQLRVLLQDVRVASADARPLTMQPKAQQPAVTQITGYAPKRSSAQPYSGARKRSGSDISMPPLPISAVVRPSSSRKKVVHGPCRAAPKVATQMFMIGMRGAGVRQKCCSCSRCDGYSYCWTPPRRTRYYVLF